jgi:MFS family permease
MWLPIGPGTTCIGVTASLFAPNWQTYALLRFVVGISVNTIYLTAVTLLVEWVPAGWHNVTVVGFYPLMYALGECDSRIGSLYVYNMYIICLIICK